MRKIEDTTIFKTPQAQERVIAAADDAVGVTPGFTPSA